jgi:PAS domain S-box-containing protein
MAVQSNDLLAGIFDRVSDGIVALDNDWYFVYVNDSAAALLRRPASELIGKHVWTEFPEVVGLPFYHAYQRAAQEQVFVCIEEYYAPWQRWFENRIYPDAQGLTIYFTEVTERKLAEATQWRAKQLRRELKLLELVLDQVLAGYWDWNIPDHTHYMSYGWKQMLGYENDDLPTTPETWKEMIFPEDLPIVMGHFEAHVQSRGEIPYYNEVRYYHKNGSTVWMICSGQVIEWDQDDNPVRMIGCHIDITDRRKAEAKLQQANQNLERSNQDLEQFAHIISHDLQEPLRAIIGYAKILNEEFQENLTAPLAQESLAIILDGGERMRHLIQDLLAYSRLGSERLNSTSIDCNAVLTEVLQNLKVSIDETQAVVMSDPLPRLCVDRTRFLQLLQNLIANAIKFHREAPPQIHISATEQTSGQYQFSIQDNGIGIKPQYLIEIFDVFRRLHTRRQFPGTGMGLAICKKIVERHGGEIWATSELGQGTTFFFTLPIWSRGDSRNYKV